MLHAPCSTPQAPCPEAHPLPSPLRPPLPPPRNLVETQAMIAESKGDGSERVGSPYRRRGQRGRGTDSIDVDPGGPSDGDGDGAREAGWRKPRSTDVGKAPEGIICQISKRVVQDPVRSPYGHVSIEELAPRVDPRRVLLPAPSGDRPTRTERDGIDST